MNVLVQDIEFKVPDAKYFQEYVKSEKKVSCASVVCPDDMMCFDCPLKDGEEKDIEVIG